MDDSEVPTSADARLRMLPVQFIGRPDGVLLVRGCTEFHVGGEQAAEIVQAVFAAAAGEGASAAEIVELFAAPDRPAVGELIHALVLKRLLVPADSAPPPPPDGESPQDVFYWEFGGRADHVAAKLETLRVAVLGVNYISSRLVTALNACGFKSVSLVDFELLRNQRLYPGDRLSAQWEGPPPMPYEQWRKQAQGKLDCVVACTDFGGQSILRQWNEWCVGRGCHFLPVVLNQMIGTVGPLIVPGETACYECMWARENSCFPEPELRRAASVPAAVTQRQMLTGFLPPMASVLGDIAAVELAKFYGAAVPFRAGTLFEVNLLLPEMFRRRVLKIPRCRVCSPLTTKPTINLEQASGTPGERIFRPMER